MTIRSFTFNPFATNCYVCHDADGRAALIDPSCATPAECETVLQYFHDNDLSMEALLLTHAHIDHIFGCHFFEERFGQRFQMHAAARPFIARATEQAQAFGVNITPPAVPETFLSEGDQVAVGALTFDVLHTPGHSPDSICFVARDAQEAFTGDVLFQGSIGRTEGLPQTSLPQLMQSIRTKVLPLGDAMTIHPGHGPSTTVGHERAHNPFLQEDFAA
ncbi:MBL fold metallo-hydrolase [Salisaeta longa]|uniref:MBL fold metallo-hydrolase n=1 Tax=Salisaeta longa TaxID=503170 RepID=UPI0003B5D03F|nr:MBL fold metallo-hydrolase [Salisaeta longa]